MSRLGEKIVIGLGLILAIASSLAFDSIAWNQQARQRAIFGGVAFSQSLTRDLEWIQVYSAEVVRAKENPSESSEARTAFEELEKSLQSLLQSTDGEAEYYSSIASLETNIAAFGELVERDRLTAAEIAEAARVQRAIQLDVVEIQRLARAPLEDARSLKGVALLDRMSLAGVLATVALGGLVLWLYGCWQRDLNRVERLQQSQRERERHIEAYTADLQRLSSSWAMERDRRQTLESLNQSLEQEREVTDLKLRFFSLASHELRTPLSTILVSAQLLAAAEERSWSLEKRHRNLVRIQSSAKSMTQLLADILLLTRAEAGRLEFKPQPMDIVEFVSALVEEIRFTHGQQHNLIFTNTGNYSYAYVDEQLLRSILSNLIVNAIKYSPTDSDVRINLENRKGLTVARVSDRGIGIPDEDRQHLFESFHRGRNAERTPGTGLGLAVVRKCLELHDGSIHVESELGVGTSFTLSIPWSIGALPWEEDAAPETGSDTGEGPGR